VLRRPRAFAGAAPKPFQGLCQDPPKVCAKSRPSQKLCQDPPKQSNPLARADLPKDFAKTRRNNQTLWQEPTFPKTLPGSAQTIKPFGKSRPFQKLCQDPPKQPNPLARADLPKNFARAPPKTAHEQNKQ